jgi:hypothetical protein
LLSVAFLAPLAAHGRTWDPDALRTALLQAGMLALAAAWLLKGLARGRWETASATLKVAAPTIILAAWTMGAFAFAPAKAAHFASIAGWLSVWCAYVVCAFEFGGARHAARLAFWTAAAAALLGAACAAGRARTGFMDSETLATFAAVALPVVLSLRLDPESSRTRRLFSLSAAAVLAFVEAWTGSPRGLAFFFLSAGIFSASTLVLFRSDPARRTAAFSLGTALLAVAIGFDSLKNLQAVAFPSLGAVEATLWTWSWTASVVGGYYAARELRRRGAAAEAGYCAAFSSAFAAWGLGAAAGLSAETGPGTWLAWACAGIAVGMLALARSRAVMRALPLPFSDDVRRLMQGPVLMLFVGALFAPGLQLTSDVRYNRAVAEARAGNLDAALADAGSVWRFSPIYPGSLYLRGRTLLKEGKPAEALTAFAALDAASPDFGRVHAQKAAAYARLEDWSAASGEYARQDDLSGVALPELLAWTAAARASGDLSLAQRCAQRAQLLAPDDAEVRAQLAANFLQERKIAERTGAARNRKGLALKPRAR